MNNENNKYSQSAREIINRLQQQCDVHKNSCIMPEHLLLELCAPTTASAALMHKIVSPQKLEELAADLSMALGTSNFAEQPQEYYNRIVSLIIKLSILEARYLRSNQVDEIHLLLALLHNKEVKNLPLFQPFLAAGIDYDTLRKLAREEVETGDTATASIDSDDDEPVHRSHREDEKEEDSHQSRRQNSPRGKADTPTLDK